MVDDERKIRDTVRVFLEHERYVVLTAGTGQQALDVAARLHPDLVVLDLMLPDLPGEEVARSLRAITDVPTSGPNTAAAPAAAAAAPGSTAAGPGASRAAAMAGTTAAPPPVTTAAGPGATAAGPA